eukprot:scaffold37690_cov128-Skeletonema_marinoi.AAC.4
MSRLSLPNAAFIARTDSHLPPSSHSRNDPRCYSCPWCHAAFATSNCTDSLRLGQLILLMLGFDFPSPTIEVEASMKDL